jgi:short-subunit dehydrogenase
VSGSRHVLVTGASSGIGASLALALAKRGDRLTLLGRDATRLSDTVERCTAAGSPDATSHCCDVTDAGAMADVVAAADAARSVDIVVVNAGLGGRAVLAGAAGEPPSVAREIVAVNLIGAINTVAPLLGRFVERKRGHVVLVSSIAARQGLAESPVYAASKAALSIYGEGLRRLLGPSGVCVTVIEPGYVSTRMARSLPFQRPFETDAESAAALIVKAVEGGRPRLRFPWQMHLGASLVGLLPLPLADRVLAAASARTRLQQE